MSVDLIEVDPHGTTADFAVVINIAGDFGEVGARNFKLLKAGGTDDACEFSHRGG